MRERFQNFLDRPFEEKIVFLVTALLLLSLVGCSVSAIAEIIALRPPKKFVRERSVVSGKLRAEPKPPVHPLEMLPEMVEGFRTNARQKMPGAEGYIAEAIYQPDDSDVITMTPLNTYVSITYHYSKKKAEEAISLSVQERYPLKKRPVEIDGVKATSGFDDGSGSYYVGWTLGQYAIELYTTYTVKVPPNGEDLLVDYGKKASIAVGNRSQNALGR